MVNSDRPGTRGTGYVVHMDTTSPAPQVAVTTPPCMNCGS